jgi:hypothetical protein
VAGLFRRHHQGGCGHGGAGGPRGSGKLAVIDIYPSAVPSVRHKNCLLPASAGILPQNIKLDNFNFIAISMHFSMYLNVF